MFPTIQVINPIKLIFMASYSGKACYIQYILKCLISRACNHFLRVSCHFATGQEPRQHTKIVHVVTPPHLPHSTTDDEWTTFNDIRFHWIHSLENWYLCLCSWGVWVIICIYVLSASIKTNCPECSRFISSEWQLLAVKAFGTSNTKLTKKGGNYFYISTNTILQRDECMSFLD